MAVIVEDGRLTLTGYVGESTLEIDGWTIFDGFTHAEVVAALGEIGDDRTLTVHINSGGGYAIEGAAIRSALADRTGRTNVVVDGIAASAASLIAMAGETVSMSLGSLMMIHDPSGFTIGTVEDHEKSIKGLNSLGNTYARVYARKSGQSDEACRAIMRAETWFTPDEAVEAGFADDALDDAGGSVAAFPYQTYAHAPRELVAMAKANDWRPLPSNLAAHAATPAAQPAASTSRKEKPMADKKPAGSETAETQAQIDAAKAEAASAAVKADRERRTAIMALDEAKGREALAEHLYATTDMDVEAIKAVLATAPKGDESNGEEPNTEGKETADYEAQRLATAGAGLGGEPKPPKKTSRLKAMADARYGDTQK